VTEGASEFDRDPDGSAEKPASRGRGVFVLVALGLVAVLAVVIGVGVSSASGARALVPDVTGRPISVAAERIRSARLTTATMGAYATTDYDSGVVVDQAPRHGTSVPRGTPIQLLVAVTPTRTVVPDLYLDPVPTAQARLGVSMLRPVVYQQLSDTVPYGRVVSQMPRAGQVVKGGQQVAIFQSMGRGTGGAVVPSVLGQPVDQAATDISDVFLVAILFDARPGTVPSGRVTDQVPAPGSRVPFGSAVPIIVTTSVN